MKIKTETLKLVKKSLLFFETFFSYSLPLRFAAFVFKLKHVNQYLLMLYRSGLFVNVFDNSIIIDTRSTRGSTISELISKRTKQQAIILVYLQPHNYIYYGRLSNRFWHLPLFHILTFPTKLVRRLILITWRAIKLRKQQTHYEKFVFQQIPSAK